MGYLLRVVTWHVTLDPPDGWCSMILLFGKDLLVPASPAQSSKDAMEAACPTHSVLIGLRTYCINSSTMIVP